MVYYMLPGMSSEVCSHTFTVIKEALLSQDFDLNSSYITSDLEQVLTQVIQINFPLTSQNGCHYHFKQCIWRKVQALGLQQQYQSDAELK